MTEPAKFDIGNLHVIDWYLWRAEKDYKRSATTGYRRPQSDFDFDIETERRESWGYDLR